MRILQRFKILKNSFFLNTLIVIASGFIIKVLGLFNKIIITRLLGTAGMGLYIMAFPTIMLFINLSAMSLNVAISKLVAEGEKLKKYSPRKLIKQGIKISMIASIITITILLAIIKILANDWLKNPDLFYPLLSTVFLIPLVGITDTLKGYFNGLKKMAITSSSHLIEQITRIIFAIVFLYLFLPLGLILATTFSLLALSFGELCSIIFLIIKIKKHPPQDYQNSQGETKAILKIALPTTTNRMIGSFTYFLEPIVYTYFLSKMLIASNVIQEEYTIINAYAIPLLTTASFLSLGIATTLIPSIAENYVLNHHQAIAYLTRKTIIYALLPGIIIAILLYLYPLEYMRLIYDTSQGTKYIQSFIFIFLIYYLQAPLVAILQATNHAKAILVTSTTMNILRIILIGSLSLVPSITTDSIFYAILITMVLATIILALIVFTNLKIKLELNTIISIVIAFIFTYFLGIFLKQVLDWHYLLVSLLLLLIFYLVCKWLKLIEIKSLTRSKLKN